MSRHRSGSRPRGPASGELEALLGRFALAPPGLVGRREFLSRTDSKFVLPASDAVELLLALTGDYAVLAAGAARLAAYRTLYFDTADLELFHAQRRGRRLRQKVRIRHYPDRQLSFLEVKTRTGESQTAKSRLQHPYGDNELGPEDIAFVRANTGLLQDLSPQVWTDFHRVTLVGVCTNERVTVDFDLCANLGPLAECLSDAAIVEVKQCPLDRRTPVMRALRTAGWRPGWASKYCTAITLAHPELRCNQLLPGLRALKGAAA